MNLRWFLSADYRRAADACKHVRRLLDSQRDLLSPQAIEAVESAVQATRAAMNSNDEALAESMAALEKAAEKWIKPYPNAEWRENIEVFLVAIAVAMAVRTFFLQPFKIPTGSMQPTLYGVTFQDLHDDQNFKMPGFFGRIYDAVVYGKVYHEIIAPDLCQFLTCGPLTHPIPFLNKQDLTIQFRDGHTQTFTVWCGPDDNGLELQSHVSLRRVFQKGEPIIRISETTGDHLFVNRFTYNFRGPERGEIIVFKTRGIEAIHEQNQFYIKRLIGLPNENVSVGEDRHVRIDGLRLDASTPHFENVYGFDPTKPPMPDEYSGHTEMGNLTSPDKVLHVDAAHYVAFGDNTMNSSDSRYWGELPQENVIGKSSFVYWPISPRFGWGSSIR